MRAPAWTELLHLPERVAGHEYLSSGNRRHVHWMLAASMAAASVVVLAHVVESNWLGAAPWLAVLAYSVFLIGVRGRPVFRRHSDEFQLGLVILVLLAIAATLPEPAGVWAFAGVVFPGFLVLLRWRGTRLLVLAGTLLAISSWAANRAEDDARLPILLVGVFLIGAMTWFGWRLTGRRLAGFYAEFRRQVGVERDRARMSEELSDARAVQLSMLPRDSPELPWVDAASACLPATEVGGDYYDFLVLDRDRLAVVIGDVAGHGMASGLVLAGVRSGLYLLRDRLDRGVEVLEKLNAMLQDTAPGRMFVTLQIVVLDWRLRQVTVANAGHPQLLLLSDGRRSASAIGAPGPPLGTRLEASYAAETHDLEASDTLVLFSDGLSEVRNHRGESFYGDRLEAEVLRAAREPTARGVRDQMLARVSHFKGDAEQEDDLTLVVLRLARA